METFILRNFMKLSLINHFNLIKYINYYLNVKNI